VLYQQKKRDHPERWSGKVRNWQHEAAVELNPEQLKYLGDNYLEKQRY